MPLEKINAKERHRRHWFLGAAFAIAMMLGAGSALLASYLRLRSAPEAASEISEQAVVAAPLVEAESVPSESPVVESVEEPSVPAGVPEKPTVRHRTVVRQNSDVPRNAPKVNEEDQLNQIRDAVLYDEWQERRARRATRRERRRVDHYNHRDLSNLDEIFEGRPRP